MMAQLEQADEIAFDTEADSFYSYKERVCLIQITALDVDYVVDPLCKFDVAGLGDILADPNKTKVFHDGEYDVLILKRDYGFGFAGIVATPSPSASSGRAGTRTVSTSPPKRAALGSFVRTRFST